MNLQAEIDCTEALVKSGWPVLLSSGEVIAKEFKDTASSLLMLKTWINEGRKTFVVPEKLLNLLRNTDVPDDFSFGDLRLPFPAFCLECESGIVVDNNLRQTKYNMASSYTHAFIIDYETIHRYNYEHFNKEVAPFDFEFRDRQFVILFVARAAEGKGVYDYVFLPFSNHQTLKTVQENPLYFQFERMSEVMNAVINTWLYIIDPSRRSDSEAIKHRSILVNKQAKGKKRFIDHEYIYLHPPKSSSGDSSSLNERHIDKRFIVRGHWRRQAYGHMYTERKLTWIKPHWKGPTMAEVVNKKYLISEEK